MQLDSEAAQRGAWLREVAQDYFAKTFPGVFTPEEVIAFYEDEIERPPADALSPNWKENARCHNWHNYASEAVEKIWDTFTPKQKIILAAAMQSSADAEDWDRD